MKKFTLMLLFLLGANIFLFAGENGPTSREILNTMINKINGVKTLKFTLKSWERVKGKDVYNDIDCKLQMSPFKIYLLSKAEPNKGVEILYNEAEWGKKVKVNPGKMLPNVTLDPYGMKLRKDQHHTIFNSGFSFVATVVKKGMQKADVDAPGKFEELFKYEGDVVWNGITCYKITITDPTFKYVDYTVKEGETCANLEMRNYYCGYLIVDKNPSVSDVTSLEAGMKVKVPSSYAKKTVLLIDKATYMPIVQTMYDEIGQFERYEFHNVVVNPSLPEKEFTTDCTGCNF